MKRIVFFSGGVASYCAAKRTVAAHGPDAVVLLFTDTKIEDDALYVFLDAAAAKLGARLVKIADGRTPWEVFRDVRAIGNPRMDPCSRVLKRDLARSWVKANHGSDDAAIVYGFDWTEGHRLARCADRWVPYLVEGPLLAKPYLEKPDMLEILRDDGLEPSPLYALGFPHANCGGFCVKAGHAHFRRLLEALPDLFAEHEQREQELREFLGKDVSILRDRERRCPGCGSPSSEEASDLRWRCLSCGEEYAKTRPFTLRAFRERQEAGGQCDLFDWGGCGCMSD